MTSSQRSKLGSVAVFILIAAGVIGGMTWGSINSLRLTKEHVSGEISRAVWEMSNYMAGIINAETARDWTDYQATHEARDFAAFSRGGVELNADYVLLRSPLAVDVPPHDWIDLYFQVDPKGVLSSPQFTGDSEPWAIDYPRAAPPYDDRPRETAEWLKTVLPGSHLEGRFAAACIHDGNFSNPERLSDGTPMGKANEQDPLSPTAQAHASSEYQRRVESLRRAQKSYLPSPDCVDASITERNLLNIAGLERGEFNEELLELTGEVQVHADPITTFWMEPGPNGEWKLAFLRECHADALVFYQGFIADWARLKPELLAQLGDRFPSADLVPVPDDAEPDLEESLTRLNNLPVRMTTSDIPGGVSAAAWRRVRGTLITTWLAAAAVLVVAGWGLRNLVALTERRMQFAYAVTHELRTPLTTFRLYSDMLSSGMVPDESKQQYLDTLNQESIRLSSLVEDVLEYARLENHKVQLTPTETDAGSLLRAVAETLQEQCEQNGLEARTENLMSNGLPLQTDVDLVNRITGVLIHNACRHARGKNGGMVLLCLDGEDGKVHLNVIDSGPGIKRSDARNIFRPFRRGEGAGAAGQGGVGLGLALARSWAGLLGGGLELVSRRHVDYGGAHFRVTIPTRIQA